VILFGKKSLLVNNALSHNNDNAAAQRWRKLPADFVNATQFYQNLKPRKSRRIPEAEAGAA